MKKTALIMAGGRGERFWPKSRKNTPKQFLSLTDDGKTMIQLTVERILPLVDMKDIFIATNKDYQSLVEEQLPDIPKDNILYEPVGKNTAPCIGLGAVHVLNKYEDAIMMILPSDHLIKCHDIFTKVLDDSCTIAEVDNNLVTIGITPNYPETGYGYIKFNSDIRKGSAYDVDSFVEKPDLDTAKEYLSSGDYLWNSGMFVWKASSIMHNIEVHLPELYKGLVNIKNSIGKPNNDRVLTSEFNTFRSISIDFGIMEKAKDIYTIPGAFGWDDVGSWLAVERIKESKNDGNICDGNVISIDNKNCIIQASEKLIATIGLENLVIVDTDDVTLICNKDKADGIKMVLENLKSTNRIEYL